MNQQNGIFTPVPSRGPSRCIFYQFNFFLNVQLMNCFLNIVFFNNLTPDQFKFYTSYEVCDVFGCFNVIFILMKAILNIRAMIICKMETNHSRMSREMFFELLACLFSMQPVACLLPQSTFPTTTRKKKCLKEFWLML